MSSAVHPDGRWSFDVKHATPLDGDTAVVEVDVGFGISHTFALRLAGISAPELGQPGGTEALEAFSRWLVERTPLIAIVHRRASGAWVRSFARWVGNLRSGAGSAPPAAATMVAEGPAWSLPPWSEI